MDDGSYSPEATFTPLGESCCLPIVTRNLKFYRIQMLIKWLGLRYMEYGHALAAMELAGGQWCFAKAVRQKFYISICDDNEVRLQCG
jgi:hypothetical protein